MNAPRFNAGIANINTVVGDLARNSKNIIQCCDDAVRKKISYLLFPEHAITGYGLEDHFHWEEVTQKAWERLQEITEHTKRLCITIGLPVEIAGQVYNAAALCADQKIHGLTLKEQLPTYDIYYEDRYFARGHAGKLAQANGVPAGDVLFDTPLGKIAPEICEDAWSSRTPGTRRALAGAEIIANPSASNFAVGKDRTRRTLFEQRSFDAQGAYLMSNLLGTETGRVLHDGGGHIFEVGEEKLRAPRFGFKEWQVHDAEIDIGQVRRQRRENTTWRKMVSAFEQEQSPKPHTVSVDADLPRNEGAARVSLNGLWLSEKTEPQQSERDTQLDDIEASLALTLVDYMRKIGAKGIKLPFSGGRDSALIGLVAARAAKALKEEHQYPIELTTFYLKGPFTSEKTLDAAKSLAADLEGIAGQPVKFLEEDTRDIQEAIRAFVARGREQEQGVYPEYHSRIGDQNVQSRSMQAATLTFANQNGSVVLTTSNFSEIAVGYATLSGDLQGSYNPLANLPKTVINTLLDRWAAREDLPGLNKVLTIAPSAELAEGQEDEKDLPPYPVQDAFHYLNLEQKRPLPEIVQILMQNLPDIGIKVSKRQIKIWVVQLARLFQYAQYKREQMPHGLKLYDTDLSPEAGLRWPVIAKREDIDVLEKELLKEDLSVAEALFPKALDYA